MSGRCRTGTCEAGLAQWTGVNGSQTRALLLERALGVCIRGLGKQFLAGLVAGRGYVVDDIRR
jgi:hypothetical protein